jgi:hypothetical protein
MFRARRRSKSGPGGGGRDGEGAGAAANASPQLPQKAWPEGFNASHWGQRGPFGPVIAFLPDSGQQTASIVDCRPFFEPTPTSRRAIRGLCTLPDCPRLRAGPPLSWEDGTRTGRPGAAGVAVGRPRRTGSGLWKSRPSWPAAGPAQNLASRSLLNRLSGATWPAAGGVGRVVAYSAASIARRGRRQHEGPSGPGRR